MDETEIISEAQIGTTVRGRPLPRGHKKGTYHNPETGQEFYNLPNDAFSREHYERRHRLQHDYSELQGEERIRAAFGTKLVYGPAPAELKKKWDEREPEVDAATVTQSAERAANQELRDMVKALAQQVSSLKDEIRQSKNDPYADIIEVEEEESEPEYELDTQIAMFE